MKKIYIIPEVEIYETAVCDMLLESSDYSFDRDGTGGTVGEEDVLGRDDSWRHGNNNAWDQGW